MFIALQNLKATRRYYISYHLPEVVVHGLEEKLIVGPIEDVFEVGQRDFVGRDRQLDQIRRVLVIDMIDHFGLFHITKRNMY